MTDQLATALSKPFFLVAGAPESGAGWVRSLLDSHPEIACAEGGHFTDWLAVAVKDLMGDYNEKLRAAGSSYPGFAQGDFRALVRTAIGLLQARLPRLDAVRVLGETTAVHAHNLDFLDLLFPDMKLVHVVRDGRDAAAAALAKDPAGLEAFTITWIDAVRTACAFGASRPERYFEVRLEDLVADPHTHLEPVLRFLGVEPGGALPVPAAPEPADALDEATRAALTARMGPLLRQFDYSA